MARSSEGLFSLRRKVGPHFLCSAESPVRAGQCASVKHFPEHQALGWRSHACDAPIFRFKHLWYIRRRKFSLANLNYRSDNSAAHFVKEPVPFDDKSQQRTFSAEIAAMKSSNGRFHFVVPIVCKRREVSLADKVFGGGFHFFEV